ncbi:MAG: hypothetical protein HeimC2_26330 [Candidatus Heimdallarchaeota archaeon LC_2]|nr:MAG: hypothetical protein HeimC2_26330 [Candidatus Heimdallarchaeota archaeon LC_2]
MQTSEGENSIPLSHILKELSQVDLIVALLSVGIATVTFQDEKMEEMINNFIVPIFGLIVISVFATIFMLLIKIDQVLTKLLFQMIIKLSIIGTLIPFTFLILWVIENNYAS